MIKYVGVNDRKIDLFEGQFDVPEGISYNSYLIIDNEIALVDTVDVNFKDEFFNNINKEIGNKAINYLIIDHMEPDHSALVNEIIKKYPNIKVVGNQKTFVMLKQFFPTINIKNEIVVKEGDTIKVGSYELKFYMAPMVHWPEVMMTYLLPDKILFSADAFGKFGALDFDDPEGWACEARRYYFGIVGKYGSPVQTLLKKLAIVDINAIYPLHGPQLTDNLSYYIDLYNTWSKYEVEENGVCVAYSSVYGNTKEAALLLADNIEIEHEVFDLSRDDIHEAVEAAFEFKYLVLASITYNGEIFPKMLEFLNMLKERGYQNRTVMIIENGSWAPMAKKYITNFLADFKNVTILEDSLTIKSALTEENKKEIERLAKLLK